MPYLTDTQRQFLVNYLADANWFQKRKKTSQAEDYERRKGKVVVEMNKLPDACPQWSKLKQALDAADRMADGGDFKQAYKDLEDVKEKARKAAAGYNVSKDISDLESEIGELCTAVREVAKVLKKLNDWHEGTDSIIQKADSSRSARSTLEKDYDKALKKRPKWESIDEFVDSWDTRRDVIQSRLRGLRRYLKENHGTRLDSRTVDSAGDTLFFGVFDVFGYPPSIAFADVLAERKRSLDDRLSNQCQEIGRILLKAKGLSEHKRATLMVKWCRVKVPEEHGESASFVINDGNGKPAFIFKPQQGEEPQEGFPEGGGAPRELLMSHVGDLLKSRVGLDCHVCKATCVELNGDQFRHKKHGEVGGVGALLEFAENDGSMTSFVGGKFQEKVRKQKRQELQQQGVTDMKEIERAEISEYHKQTEQRLRTIPAEDVHAIAVMDFVTLNLDRQADNLLVKDDHGTIRLIPIDAGNALPSAWDRTTGMTSLPKPKGEGPSSMGNCIAQLPHMHQPFSKEMVKKILKLKSEDIAGAMRKDYRNLVKAHPELKDKISDETFTMVEKSIEFLCVACKELTPYEISLAYGMHLGPVMAAKDPVELQSAIENAIEAARKDAAEFRKEFDIDDLK